MTTRAKAEILMIMSHSQVRCGGHTMDSRQAMGLQYTCLYRKFTTCSTGGTPELNPKPMSAFSPLHDEWTEIEGRRSYRLPDSLCNGAVKLFAIGVIIVCR